MDCCLSNDDAYVVGGSEDGYIYFWDLVDASVVASLRAHSSVVFILSKIASYLEATSVVLLKLHRSTKTIVFCELSVRISLLSFVVGVA
jgi:WD40 repeat protein